MSTLLVGHTCHLIVTYCVCCGPSSGICSPLTWNLWVLIASSFPGAVRCYCLIHFLHFWLQNPEAAIPSQSPASFQDRHSFLTGRGWISCRSKCGVSRPQQWAETSLFRMQSRAGERAQFGRALTCLAWCETLGLIPRATQSKYGGAHRESQH